MQLILRSSIADMLKLSNVSTPFVLVAGIKKRCADDTNLIDQANLPLGASQFLNLAALLNSLSPV